MTSDANDNVSLNIVKILDDGNIVFIFSGLFKKHIPFLYLILEMVNATLQLMLV